MYGSARDDRVRLESCDLAPDPERQPEVEEQRRRAAAAARGAEPEAIARRRRSPPLGRRRAPGSRSPARAHPTSSPAIPEAAACTGCARRRGRGDDAVVDVMRLPRGAAARAPRRRASRERPATDPAGLSASRPRSSASSTSRANRLGEGLGPARWTSSPLTSSCTTSGTPPTAGRDHRRPDGERLDRRVRQVLPVAREQAAHAARERPAPPHEAGPRETRTRPFSPTSRARRSSPARSGPSPITTRRAPARGRSPRSRRPAPSGGSGGRHRRTCSAGGRRSSVSVRCRIRQRPTTLPGSTPHPPRSARGIRSGRRSCAPAEAPRCEPRLSASTARPAPSWNSSSVPRKSL